MKNDKLIKVINILCYLIPAIIAGVGVIITTYKYFEHKSHSEWSAPASTCLIYLGIYLVVALLLFVAGLFLKNYLSKHQ